MCANNRQSNINEILRSFTGSNVCFLNEVLLHNSITLHFRLINPGHIDTAALADYDQVRAGGSLYMKRKL